MIAVVMVTIIRRTIVAANTSSAAVASRHAARMDGAVDFSDSSTAQHGGQNQQVSRAQYAGLMRG